MIAAYMSDPFPVAVVCGSQAANGQITKHDAKHLHGEWVREPRGQVPTKHFVENASF